MNPKAKSKEYNTSDVGYMDEEWINYVPDWMKSDNKKENQIEDEQQVEEVQ
jgi:hypothetical protein